MCTDMVAAADSQGTSGDDRVGSEYHRKAAFKATRLTPSTFVIEEYADIYDEHPLIYAKLCSEINTIVIVDTGCGGATNDQDVNLTSLRAFIETVPVADNGHQPLNEGGKMEYIVVLSHCHYDHIRELSVTL